ncbi:glutamine amidotransferase-related protein [Almyronema epifaneia]|uniref:Glutamine amidotransferase n=1 Tax=Almyronema epifaneia S1 TaxID=2991925 RepID=A0ABW6IIR6_9CYAN
MNQVLLVVHQETSNPGLVGHFLKTKGYALDMRCPALGDELPQSLEEHAAVVVFGGPMSANDDHTLPFIRQELDWIEQVLAAEKPFLGICLGAQLLTRVLGAQVRSHPQAIREIGYYPITPTAAGKEYFQTPMHVYHWHQEGFEIPLGATLLAEGENFANQAFCYGDFAFGLQFHPEITAEMIDLWTTKAADQLQLPGAQSRQQHFELHTHHSPTVQSWLSRFLAHWLGEDPTRQTLRPLSAA